MARIFLNYRRDDAADWAQHHLYPALTARFGQGEVFLDVDADIPKGRDYRPQLHAAVERCAVMVAVIGHSWLLHLGHRAAAHEQDPDVSPDSVRVEIAHALLRDIPVIPLLVSGARPPAAAELPEELRALAFRQTATATYPNLAADIATLVQAIEAELGVAPPSEAVRPSPRAGAPASDALARVEDSLDVDDYRDLEEMFPGTDEAFEARRRRRRLTAWAALNQDDPAAIAAFRATGLFAALDAVAARAEPAARRADLLRRAPEILRAGGPEIDELPAGTLFRDPLRGGGVGPEMALIPAGRFLMGSPEDEPERLDREGPQHEVRFERPFSLGRFAVSFDEFDTFCGATRRIMPNDREWGRGRRPVISVSCDDAQAYCDWLSSQTGAEYRLPSEAQWEYACRAGSTTPFWWGASISPSQANYDGNYAYGGGVTGLYRERTEPVDAFDANPWGLHQTHGNVWEWCADSWNGDYRGAPDDGSAWRSGDETRSVRRGGSWVNAPRGLRSAIRSKSRRVNRSDGVGFRIARTLFR